MTLREHYYQVAIGLLVATIVAMFVSIQVQLRAVTEDEAPSDKRTVQSSSPDLVNLSGPFFASDSKGLIRSGTTALDSSIGYRLTGPLEITFSEGTFTSATGQTYSLPSPQSFKVQPHQSRPKSVAFILVGNDSTTDIVKDTQLKPLRDESQKNLVSKFGDDSIETETFENELVTLVGYDWLIVPPDDESLADNQIAVFHVWDRSQSQDYYDKR